MPKGNRNASKNSPMSALAKLEGTGYCAETLPKILAISNLAIDGKPKDADELQKRLVDYFTLCVENDLRPGIENLCLSLGTDRKTFWNWCEGKDYANKPRFAELCRQARQVVVTMLEDANQNGKINPASGIFFLKNWAHYTDALQIDTKPIEEEKPIISISDLPDLNEISTRQIEGDIIDDLPQLPKFDNTSNLQ